MAASEAVESCESSLYRFYLGFQNVQKCLEGVTRIQSDSLKMDPLFQAAERCAEQIQTAMKNDFNTSEAIATVFSVLGRFQKECALEDRLPVLAAAWPLALEGFQLASKLLGIFGSDPQTYIQNREARSKTGSSLPAEEIERLISERASAKKSKDFARADAIRNELSQKGIVLEDGPSGTTWKVGRS